MICPVCSKEVKPQQARSVKGVIYHKGCAAWRTLPTHIKTNKGEILPVEVVKLNVRSARVRILGQEKTIRVTRASGKLKTLK